MNLRRTEWRSLSMLGTGVSLLTSGLISWCLICGSAHAQRLLDGEFGERRSTREQQVTASLLADVSAIESGKPFRLGVLFEVIPDWHIYWHTPGEVGLPTEIEWKLPEGFAVGELQWPKPERMEAEGVVSYGYEGEVLLFAEVRPPKDARRDGEFQFSASVSWLVCKTDGQCIPGDAEVAFSLPGGEASASESAALFNKYAATAAPAPSAATQAPGEDVPGDASTTAGTFKISELKAPAPAEQSFILMLFYALVGGMILNIMPCVLPVVSIKILSFVRQSSDDARRIFFLGLAFGAGVLVFFTVLATVVVILKALGQQVGWGFQFQEPRFVICMAALVFAFGLSLFGVFEVNLPGSALTGASGLQGREGAAGAFFNGVLATALATPCTAPVLAHALNFAFPRPGPLIYLFFLTIGVGLALPYVLLSARPGWVRHLPKPGPWMETFKQFMGFLLMATVVWLLSVLGSQVGADGVVWTLAFLTALGVACWLLGKGLDLRSGPARRRGLSIAAAFIIVFGYLYFPEKYLQRLGAIEPKTSATAEIQGKIEWLPFSTELVDRLAAENRTIFLDFTADWCLTCKANERGALASESVQDAFVKYNVAAVKVDYTNRSAEITELLRKFGRSGVPLYVIFPPGRPQEPIVLPDGILTPSKVNEKLHEAVQPKDIPAVSEGS